MKKMFCGLRSVYLIVVVIGFYATCITVDCSESLKDSIEEKIILTPKPGPEPNINGPAVYGCSGW